MKILKITSEQMKSLESFLAAKRKIMAIKYLRELTGAGLREAKDAVDQLAGVALKGPTAKVQVTWTIDSIKVTSPSGRAYELSIKELELKFLQETSSIGMNEVADLLDLTTFIKEWSGNS